MYFDSCQVEINVKFSAETSFIAVYEQIANLNREDDTETYKTSVTL